MPWIEHLYPDAATLASALAARLEDTLREAIASRGHAMLALAGGRTPLPAYRALAARTLEWQKVLVMPTDERCVPHDHAACNLREMRSAFASAAPFLTYASALTKCAKFRSVTPEMAKFSIARTVCTP